MISTKHNPPNVLGVTVTHFGPEKGAAPEHYKHGDFILTHGNTFYSYMIRFGQALRFWGKDRKYTWWNHAAMIVSPQGDLVEALGTGVMQTNLSKYKQTDYHVIHLGILADDHDRLQVVNYAKWCLGEKYGYLTIASIAVSLIMGGKFKFFYDGQQICSGLVARALERTNVIFDRSPSHIMPADLAKYFNVNPPPKGSSKGVIPKRS
jgi:uncharacterized protein YycO